MSLLNTLHKVSDRGTTVVATLHQPRQEIFDLVHNLILLAPGGRVVYAGPAFMFKDHMFQLKYVPQSERSNIADFAMDVLGGFVPRLDKDEIDNVNVTNERLCSWWAQNKIIEHKVFVSNQVHRIAERNLRMKILQRASALENTRESVRFIQTDTFQGKIEFMIDNFIRSKFVKCFATSTRRQFNVSLLKILNFVGKLILFSDL